MNTLTPRGPSSEVVCPGCGEAFETASRARIYCSDACRCRAAYARAKSGEPAHYERACVVCAGRFVLSKPGETACSEACRRQRERERGRRRLRHDTDHSLAARVRNAQWAREHRNVARHNAWLAGAPPYATHLPGVTTPITIDPLPRWPVELRNTRGLHGALSSVLDVGHAAHRPLWALRPWQSGWAVHWLHALGVERYTCTSVAVAVYDRPSTMRFGATVRWRAPRVAHRGRQRITLTTVTPVVIRTDGGASVAERASGPSLVGSLGGDFAALLAPSPMWLTWMRERLRVQVVSHDTHPTSVPLGDKYGIIRGWEGSVDLEVNAPARWMFEAATRIGLGSRIAFGFGCVRVQDA